MTGEATIESAGRNRSAVPGHPRGDPGGRSARAVALVLLALLAWTGPACEGGTKGDPTMTPASQHVRERLESLAPAAVIGHRGTGPTRILHPFPENSLSSFGEALRQGAEGVELDVEIAADGALLVMHDDTLDRTTDCTGCVSAKTLEALRDCRLLNGWGRPTSEGPPTLAEVYAALPAEALINVELKVYGSGCRTESTGPDSLARAAAAEIRRLGAAGRTLFSSFDERAIATLKSENPDLYAALLLRREESVAWEPGLERAVALGLDAVHPHKAMPRDGIEAARGRGLQVNVYTVNLRDRMEALLATGVTSIITDRPDVLRAMLPGEKGGNGPVSRR